MALIFGKDGEALRLLVDPRCIRLVHVLEDFAHVEDKARRHLPLEPNPNRTRATLSIDMRGYRLTV